jgi:hypothetical protein
MFRFRKFPRLSEVCRACHQLLEGQRDLEPAPLRLRHPSLGMFAIKCGAFCDTLPRIRQHCRDRLHVGIVAHMPWTRTLSAYD